MRPAPGAMEQSSVFGLQNIAQTCSQSDHDRWHDLVQSHFDCIFEAATDQNALTIDVRDFARMRSFLRSRLYPLDLLTQSVEAVHRPGPEGTVEVLVLDLPSSVRTVTRSEAGDWPISTTALFEISRSNLRASGDMKDNVVPLQPGVDLHLYTGDAFYAASHALIIDRYLPADLDYGTLVGIPKRDILLAHHIRNIGVTEAIGAMLQTIIGMHKDGPGSLSPNIYWYRKGEFVLLPYELTGDTLNFVPPADFAELLNELAEHANLS